MESGDRARVKTTIPRSGLSTVSRGGALMDLRITKKMKIIQFPVNIDKFTSYFDKYLKNNARENGTIIGFISAIYAVIFKQKMNILSNLIE